MLNFGLDDLRLVTPRDGWPNPSAGPAASGADIVLEKARVFDSVAEAVADCAHVYATTVRKRGLVIPVISPEAAGLEVHRNDGPSAILFGAERSGLETDEVALAGKIVTVPVNQPQWRMALVPAQGYVAVFGLPLEQLRAENQQARDTFLFALPAALGLVGLGAAFLASRAVKPVQKLSAAAERITAEGLHEQIPRSGEATPGFAHGALQTQRAWRCTRRRRGSARGFAPLPPRNSKSE